MAFTSIKQTIENVLKDYDIKVDVDAYRIFQLWDDIVGDKTARHTKPARVGDGILYIEVDDPLWLTQLRYMKIDILEKIDRTIKKGALKDIRFYLKRN